MTEPVSDFTYDYDPAPSISFFRSHSRSRTEQWQLIYVAVICLMIATLVGMLAVFFTYGIANETAFIDVAFSFVGMTFSLLLFICCYFSRHYNTRREVLFSSMVVLLFVTLFLSVVFIVFTGKRIPHVLVSIQLISDILTMLLHVLFWYYQRMTLPKNRFASVMTSLFLLTIGIYTAVIVINQFTGILYYENDAGIMIFPGIKIDLTFSGLIFLLYILVIFSAKCPVKKKLVLSSYILFPALYVAIVTLCIVLGIGGSIEGALHTFFLLATYLIFFNDYLENKQELLYRKAQLAEREKAQTDLQTALVLSQIQPHFLYNALSAIRHLCKQEPMQAYTVLGDFADYLRTNMDSLQHTQMSPFEKELEHTKTYLSIEKLRFGDDLRIVYDIAVSDFTLPALTVQPLVENAVRHGICCRENGGTVTIATRREDNTVIITIADDGPGFDPTVPPQDGKTHIGIPNVRQRLQAIADATLTVDSAPGHGTVATIRLKEEFA